MTKSEYIIRGILVALCGIGVGMLIAGCENINTNVALINTRSPVVKASGTNTVEATTNLDGGGKLDATIPIAP